MSKEFDQPKLNSSIEASSDALFNKVLPKEKPLTAMGMIETLKRWVDWYESQYGPLGLSPGRMLWEQTRDLIEQATGEPKKPLPDPVEQAKKDIAKLLEK